MINQRPIVRIFDKATDIAPVQAINIFLYILIGLVYLVKDDEEVNSLIMYMSYGIPLYQYSKIAASIAYMINLGISVINVAQNLVNLKYIKNTDAVFMIEWRQMSTQAGFVQAWRLLGIAVCFLIINKVIGEYIILRLIVIDNIYELLIYMASVLIVTDVILIVLWYLETKMTSLFVQVNNEAAVWDSAGQLAEDQSKDCIKYQSRSYYQNDKYIEYTYYLSLLLSGVSLIFCIIITNIKMSVPKDLNPVNMAIWFKALDELVGGSVNNLVRRAVYALHNDTRGVPLTSLLWSKRRTTGLGSIGSNIVISMMRNGNPNNYKFDRPYGGWSPFIRTSILFLIDIIQAITLEPVVVIFSLLLINSCSDIVLVEEVDNSHCVMGSTKLHSITINTLLVIVFCVWVYNLVEVIFDLRSDYKQHVLREWPLETITANPNKYYWSTYTEKKLIAHIGLSQTITNVFRDKSKSAYSGTERIEYDENCNEHGETSIRVRRLTQNHVNSLSMINRLMTRMRQTGTAVDIVLPGDIENMIYLRGIHGSLLKDNLFAVLDHYEDKDVIRQLAEAIEKYLHEVPDLYEVYSYATDDDKHEVVAYKLLYDLLLRYEPTRGRYLKDGSKSKTCLQIIQKEYSDRMELCANLAAEGKAAGVIITEITSLVDEIYEISLDEDNNLSGCNSDTSSIQEIDADAVCSIDVDEEMIYDTMFTNKNDNILKLFGGEKHHNVEDLWK